MCDVFKLNGWNDIRTGSCDEHFDHIRQLNFLVHRCLNPLAWGQSEIGY